MKGHLSYNKWAVWSLFGGHSYQAERIINGEHESFSLSAHCLACAKVEVLAKRGGQVDTRGWHNQGICGTFLKAMNNTTKGEN